MIAGIILFSLFALVCLLGVIQDIFGKKDAGWLTGIGCILGLWVSLILLVKCCQISSKDKEEITIEQVKYTEQIVDTIPITLTIIIQNE